MSGLGLSPGFLDLPSAGGSGLPLAMQKLNFADAAHSDPNSLLASFDDSVLGKITVTYDGVVGRFDGFRECAIWVWDSEVLVPDSAGVRKIIRVKVNVGTWPTTAGAGAVLAAGVLDGATVASATGGGAAFWDMAGGPRCWSQGAVSIATFNNRVNMDYMLAECEPRNRAASQADITAIDYIPGGTGEHRLNSNPELCTAEGRYIYVAVGQLSGTLETSGTGVGPYTSGDIEYQVIPVDGLVG